MIILASWGTLARMSSLQDVSGQPLSQMLHSASLQIRVQFGSRIRFYKCVRAAALHCITRARRNLPDLAAQEKHSSLVTHVPIVQASISACFCSRSSHHRIHSHVDSSVHISGELVSSMRWRLLAPLSAAATHWHFRVDAGSETQANGGSMASILHAGGRAAWPSLLIKGWLANICAQVAAACRASRLSRVSRFCTKCCCSINSHPRHYLSFVSLVRYSFTPEAGRRSERSWRSSGLGGRKPLHCDLDLTRRLTPRCCEALPAAHSPSAPLPYGGSASTCHNT